MGTDDHVEANTRKQVSIKVTHGAITTRATFKVADLTYETLNEWVKASFALPSVAAADSAAPGGPVSRLVYRDPEGDSVSLTSTDDLMEALRLLPADTDVLALHLSFPHPRHRWHRQMMAFHAGNRDAPNGAEAGETAPAEFLPFSRPHGFGCPPTHPHHRHHAAVSGSATTSESTDSSAAPACAENDATATPANCPFRGGRGGFGGRCGRGGFGFGGGRPHHSMDAEAWEERREACQARREARRAARAAAFASMDAADAADFNTATANAPLGSDAIEENTEAANSHHCGGRGFGFGRGGHHFGRHGHHGHHQGGHGPHGFGGPRGGRFGFGGGPHGPHHAHGHEGFHHGMPPHHGMHAFGAFHPNAMPAFHHGANMNHPPCVPPTFFPEGHVYHHGASPAHHQHPHGHGHAHSNERPFFGGRDEPWQFDRERHDRCMGRLLSAMLILSLMSVAARMLYLGSGISFVFAALAGAVAFWAKRVHRKAVKGGRRAAKRAARFGHHGHHHGQRHAHHATPASTSADEKETSSSSAPCVRPAASTEDTSPVFDFFFGRRHRHHGPHSHHWARGQSSGDEADIDSSSSPAPCAAAAATAAAAAPATLEPKCHRGMRRCRFAAAAEAERSTPAAETAAPSAIPTTVAPAAAAHHAPSFAFIEPIAPTFEQVPSDAAFAHWGHPRHPFAAPHHGASFGGPFPGAHPHHGGHHGHRRHFRHGGRFHGEETDESTTDARTDLNLKTLQEMGFSDHRMNRKLLKRLGSLPAAIAALTAGASPFTSPAPATSSVTDEQKA